MVSKILSRMIPCFLSAFLFFSPASRAQDSLSFEIGKITTLEERFNVDIVGDFSVEETSKIARLVDSINLRYPNITKMLNIVVDQSEHPWKSSSFNNAIDSRFNYRVDLVSISSSNRIDSIPGYLDPIFSDRLLWSFGDNLAHEFGHIIVGEYINANKNGNIDYSTDSTFLYEANCMPYDKMKEAIKKRLASQKLRETFLEINLNAPQINLDLKNRQIGYVSKDADFYRYSQLQNILDSNMHPTSFNKTASIYRISKEHSLEEDIAETFAYMIGGYTYADGDSSVQEKIKALEEFIEAVYGK
ncbi:hypothetical protein HYT23_05935 [Candidatus Pacearchaeota archaeon]|nr:hypothetical protein [Candidatus Pacearchaeota archaeon]